MHRQMRLVLLRQARDCLRRARTLATKGELDQAQMAVREGTHALWRTKEQKP